MGHAPRGFDRLVFLLIICCLPSAYGEGGFCWKYGSEGESCATACTSVALVCVKKFDKVGSVDNFKAASDGGVECSGNVGRSWSDSPFKCTGSACTPQNKCYYQTDSGGGSCTTVDSYVTRLCSCQCAAGTYSSSDLKPYPCET